MLTTSLQKMWYSSWSIVSSFIVENITEMQVNNPTPGYRMETEYVLLGKCSGLLAELFYNQNGLATPCDRSQTQEGERFFLNIQFGIQEIITVNLPSSQRKDHAYDLPFKVFCPPSSLGPFQVPNIQNNLLS